MIEYRVKKKQRCH